MLLNQIKRQFSCHVYWIAWLLLINAVLSKMAAAEELAKVILCTSSGYQWVAVENPEQGLSEPNTNQHCIWCLNSNELDLPIGTYLKNDEGYTLGDRFAAIAWLAKDLNSNLSISARLNYQGWDNIRHYPAEVAAVVHWPDEEETLRKMGISAVYNLYTEAGAGFAEHVLHHIELKV